MEEEIEIRLQFIRFQIVYTTISFLFYSNRIAPINFGWSYRNHIEQVYNKFILLWVMKKHVQNVLDEVKLNAMIQEFHVKSVENVMGLVGEYALNAMGLEKYLVKETFKKQVAKLRRPIILTIKLFISQSHHKSPAEFSGECFVQIMYLHQHLDILCQIRKYTPNYFLDLPKPSCP